MGRLAGKKAIVTGANSGIGQAVAIDFAKEGADVAVVDLDGGEDTLRAVEDEGCQALLLHSDIGVEENVKDIINRAVQRFGKIDILVNNAAVEHLAPIEDVSLNLWNRILQTNITGMFLMTKYCLPHIPEGGRIINTGSIEGFEGNPADLPYSASKGAVHSFTKSLAKSLVDKHITCNAVAPGPVATPMLKANMPDRYKTRKDEKYPLGIPEPKDISPTYVFLASDEAAYYSGEVLAPTAGKVTAA